MQRKNLNNEKLQFWQINEEEHKNSELSMIQAET